MPLTPPSNRPHATLWCLPCCTGHWRDPGTLEKPPFRAGALTFCCEAVGTSNYPMGHSGCCQQTARGAGLSSIEKHLVPTLHGRFSAARGRPVGPVIACLCAPLLLGAGPASGAGQPRCLVNVLHLGFDKWCCYRGAAYVHNFRAMIMRAHNTPAAHANG